VRVGVYQLLNCWSFGL